MDGKDIAATGNGAEQVNKLMAEVAAGTISRRYFLFATAKFVGGAGALGLLAQACGLNTTPATSAPGGSGTVPLAPTASAGTAASAPKRGGVLRVATSEEPFQPTFDMHEAGASVLTARTAYPVYEGLVNVDANRKAIPELAESWENPDATTYIFNLRKGVKFSDGTPFDADAAKFNIDRIRSPQSKGDRRADFTPIDTVTVMSPSQIKVTLSAPFAPMLGNFRRSFLPIMSPTAIQQNANDPFKRSIGTGSFEFVSYTRGDRTVLKRFDGYWGEPAHLDGIEVRIIPEQATALAAMQSGDLDFMMQANAAFAASIKGNPSINLLHNPSPIWNHLAMNVTRKPFTDVRVRQAFSMAIDRKNIATAIWSDLAKPANSAIGPIFKDYYKENADITYQNYDPDGAQALLKSAAYDGSEVVYDILTLNPVGQEGQAIAAQLTAIGVNVKVNQTDYNGLAERVYGPTHDFVMYTAGWTPGGVDPDAMMYKMFKTDGVWNLSKYSNSDVDRLLEQQRAELDVAKRADLLQQANRIVMTECPIGFTVNPDLVEIARKEVQNYQFRDEYSGGFNECWLDK